MGLPVRFAAPDLQCQGRGRVSSLDAGADHSAAGRPQRLAEISSARNHSSEWDKEIPSHRFTLTCNTLLANTPGDAFRNAVLEVRDHAGEGDSWR